MQQVSQALHQQYDAAFWWDFERFLKIEGIIRESYSFCVPIGAWLQLMDALLALLEVPRQIVTGARLPCQPRKA